MIARRNELLAKQSNSLYGTRFETEGHSENRLRGFKPQHNWHERLNPFAEHQASIEPANRPVRKIYPDAFNLRVHIKCMPAHLATVARLFEASEWRCSIKHVEGIDPNNSSPDLFSKPVRPRDIACPDAGGETVDRIVSLLDQFVLILEADN